MIVVYYMSTLTALSEVEMLLDLWKCGPHTLLYRRIRALKLEKCNNERTNDLFCFVAHINNQ